MYYIYCFLNKINYKIYIGITNNPKKRLTDHKYCSKNSDRYYYIHKAINKYKINNFDFVILEECENKKIAAELEKKYILLFNSTNKKLGYNLTFGGDGVCGYKPTAEQNKKRSEKMKGRKISEEHKQKLHAGRKNYKNTPERSQKISIALKKNNPNKGKTASKQQRKKMSENSGKISGNKHSQNTINKIKDKRKNQDMSFKISNPTKKQILEMWDSCEFTKNQISEITGIKRNTVSKIISIGYKCLEPKELKINQQVKEQIIELYKSGNNCNQIKQILNIGLGSIKNTIKEYRKSIGLKQTKINEKDKVLVLKLNSEKYTYKQISKITKLSFNTVRYIVRKYKSQ